MNKAGKYLAVAAVLACSTGFISSGYAMRVALPVSGPPVFTLESTQLFVSKRAPLQLKMFMVFAKRNGEWDYQNAVWSLDTPPERSVAVKTVTYGVVPAGFTERIPAQPLVPGTEYQVAGLGGGLFGGTTFTR